MTAGWLLSTFKECQADKIPHIPYLFIEKEQQELTLCFGLYPKTYCNPLKEHFIKLNNSSMFNDDLLAKHSRRFDRSLEKWQLFHSDMDSFNHWLTETEEKLSRAQMEAGDVGHEKTNQFLQV
ncbi:hypothetical protein Q9233_007996 [Columba guinea]|nr:hypothetical protein Q9233_007996 [Columba guinea]